MDLNIIKGADAIGMFCRLHMNTKRNLPIRPSEMGVLIFTQKQSTAVTPLMISQFFKITKPSVTALVTSLVKDGYLTKELSDADKRSYALRITEKGNDLVDSTFVEYYKSIEILKDNMGEEKFAKFIELVELAGSIWDEVE
ncbi:MAG: MarR family transcriptional regulator [Clostridiales bacterium]|nr:MarR family transcriptional regulator [Clostridiales bacterium]MDW7661124.1 MarR family transcriptional regulator [Bacillota bacterium]